MWSALISTRHTLEMIIKVIIISWNKYSLGFHLGWYSEDRNFNLHFLTKHMVRKKENLAGALLELLACCVQIRGAIVLVPGTSTGGVVVVAAAKFLLTVSVGVGWGTTFVVVVGVIGGSNCRDTGRILWRNRRFRSVTRRPPSTTIRYWRCGRVSVTKPVFPHFVGLIPCWFWSWTESPMSNGFSSLRLLGVEFCLTRWRFARASSRCWKVLDRL